MSGGPHYHVEKVEGKFGPKLTALPGHWQRFVLAMVEHGYANPVEALLQEGVWPGTHASNGAARVKAWRLMHDERVQAAIHEEATRRLVSLSPLALRIHRETLENPQTDPAVRLKAVGMVYDRAGLHAVSEHKSTVEHLTSTDKEQLARISAMAKALGIDPSQLLGDRLIEAPVIDMVPVGADEDPFADVEY